MSSSAHVRTALSRIAIIAPVFPFAASSVKELVRFSFVSSAWRDAIAHYCAETWQLLASLIEHQQSLADRVRVASPPSSSSSRSKSSSSNVPSASAVCSMLPALPIVCDDRVLWCLDNLITRGGLSFSNNVLLMHAVRRGAFAMCKYLCARRRRSSLSSSSSPPPSSSSLPRRTADDSSLTPLSLACAMNQTDIAMHLLASPAFSSGRYLQPAVYPRIGTAASTVTDDDDDDARCCTAEEFKSCFSDSEEKRKSSFRVGHSPLWYAAARLNLTLVKALLERGSNPLELESSDDTLEAATTSRSSSFDTCAAAAALTMRATISSNNSGSGTMVMVMTGDPHSVELQAKRFEIFRIIAEAMLDAATGNGRFVPALCPMVLLATEASSNIFNSRSSPLLPLVCRPLLCCAAKRLNVQAVQFLLERGANPSLFDASSSSSSSSGRHQRSEHRSALHHVCKIAHNHHDDNNGNNNCASFTVLRQSDVDALAEHNRFISQRQSMKPFSSQQAANGATSSSFSSNSKQGKKTSAAAAAAAASVLSAAQQDAATRGNSRTNGDESPSALLASTTPHEEDCAPCKIAQLLLLYGADADDRVSTQKTPLHCAVQMSCPAMVTLLLANGASLQKRDGVSNESCGQIAHRCGRSDNLAVLYKFVAQQQPSSPSSSVEANCTRASD